MSLGTDASVIERALSGATAWLREEIRLRPLVARAVGRHLLRRLAADDWIKSPLLTSFLRPMGLPRLWRPSPGDVRHVLSRESELGQRATGLDAFEDALRGFEERAVGGVGQWFKELARLRGYWFDKRMQTLEFEVYAAVAIEWAEVAILERDPGRKTPDFVARAPGLIIVGDAKLLLGKHWPVKIVGTMLRALEASFGLKEVRDVIVVPSTGDIDPESLEVEVDELTVDALVAAVRAVARGSGRFPVTGSLAMEPATERDRFYGQRAFPAHFPGREEWGPLFDSLSTRFGTIRKHCHEAWEQCEAYDMGESVGESRLDVAFVAGEYFLLHEDLGPTQALVRGWLGSEVWPGHPERAVVMASTEMLKPVWFVNRALRTAQARGPARGP
jgi:hypothetical protein